MDIYPTDRNLPHTPYFYIIQHISTGKKYVGCKFAIKKSKFSDNGCHPIELLKPGGYPTSSETIKGIIDKEGLGAFRIIEIVVEADMNGLTAYEYETKFLQENNIAGKPDQWYNKHNNDKKFNDIERRETVMLERYGVTNAMQHQEFKEKAKLTNLERYGVDYVSQSPEFKEKTRLTNLERYGVDYVSQSPEIQEKIKSNNQIKYGVDYPSQTEEARSAARKRMTGDKYYNDGIKNYRVKLPNLPEESWVRGRIINYQINYKKNNK